MSKELLGFSAMLVGLLMALLDIQIVTSSLVEIGTSVGATVEEISWIQTAYLIAEAIMIALTGWLARSLSSRWLFVIAASFFTLFSLLCGLSWDLASLTIFRALQGLFGGAMIPLTFGAMYYLFPKEKHAQMGAMLALFATLAPTFGPIVGGYITEALSWRFIFFINVIPGIAITLIVSKCVDFDRPNLAHLATANKVTILLLVLFLGLFEYILEEGHKVNWLDDEHLTQLIIVDILLFITLLLFLLKDKHPIIDLSILKDRNFNLGLLLIFMIGTGHIGAAYILPLFLGEIKGFTPRQIGEVMLITGIFQMVSSPIIGKIASKMDIRLLLFIGLSLFGISLFSLSPLSTEWGYEQFFVPQALRGIAFLFIMLPAQNIAMSHLAKVQISNASALFNLFRNLGAAIGLTLINTSLFRQSFQYETHLSSLISNQAASEIANRLLASGNVDQYQQGLVLADRYLQNSLISQAKVMAYSDTYLLLAVSFFIMLAVIPFIKKHQTKKAA
jgi:DHA2 family multidrug resistance protein